MCLVLSCSKVWKDAKLTKTQKILLAAVKNNCLQQGFRPCVCVRARTPLTWEGAFDEVFKKQQVVDVQLCLDVKFGYQRVAAAKLALEVLGTTEALELTVDHHRQPGAQGLALLHTKWIIGEKK